MTDFSPSRRFVMAAGSSLLIPGVAKAQATAPVVETTAGRVRGYIRNGTRIFKAIPYGDNTAGANRFMPPRPPKPWAGVKECFEYGPQTPQGDGSLWEPEAPSLYTDLYERLPEVQSEDCLVLNVWTPALDNARRPVMFWIHGGGFSTGSGASKWYDGTNIAQKQDVVVVTINHRLNVFGYSHLGAFHDDFADSSNCGTLDAAAALRWVRDNIANFGGDPDRVMVHGQSGGGRKTTMVLTNTETQGLFHRAVVQSGSQLRVDTPEMGEARAARLLQALDIAPRDVHRLQQLPVTDIQRVQGAASRGQWRPVAGSPSLPHHPSDPEAIAMSRNIPVMIGTCRTENSGFMAGDPAMDTLSDEALLARLENAQAGEGRRLYDMYRRIYPTSANAEIAYMASTDPGYFLASCIQADLMSEAHREHVYYYSFDRETPVDGGRFYAPHAEEIPFVFDSLEYGQRIAGPQTPQSQALADQVSALWANFARNGIPSATGVRGWSPYNTASRPTLMINYESDMQNDPRGEQRETWQSFGLPGAF